MATAVAICQETRPAIRWEEPDCLLCGSAHRDTVLEAPDQFGDHLWFAVVRCRGCGLHYTCPRPDEQTIGGFYPADYQPHRPRHGRSDRAAPPWSRLLGRPCPERRSLPHHGQCRLLDFGCGGGDFLERTRTQGWNVTGLDACPITAAAVRGRLDVPVLAGTLPHPDLAPASFDVVTMWQALEHVHQPLVTLRAARELLAPGGKLYIAVPNIESWPFRWFGTSWFGLDVPRHLTHFTPDTLSAMIVAAGFQNTHIRQVRHSDWLRASAAHAAQRPNPTAWSRWLTRKPLARRAAWACYAAGQADCMLASAEV